MKITQVKNNKEFNEQIMYLFNSLCEKSAYRIKQKKGELGLLEEDICFPMYIVSRIINNRIDKQRNPYLIPPKALLGNDKSGIKYKGICEALDFINPLEVLIGNKVEQSDFIDLYYKIIKRYYLLYLNDNEILNNALSKYLIITYYLTFINNGIIPENYAPLKIIKKYDNDENFLFFKTKALEFLYKDIEEDFERIFYQFAGRKNEEQVYFYRNLCKHTKDIFIEKLFMNLLKTKYNNINPISLHLKNTINDSLKTFNDISKNISPRKKKELLIATIESINEYTYKLDELEYRKVYGNTKNYEPFLWSFKQ